ncbi:MAG TPA: 3-phenylpropionate/cinnamic acid dioxygenase subunit beta [Candidatus Binatia bacterium]|jgi:3-phenylpropionate/cinnamic acid dioxygenase small subunit
MTDSRRQVEDFLYLEAEILDGRRFRDWLDILTDDVRYWMPIRHNPVDRPEAPEDELSKPGEGYYFNETKETLRIRVERLYLRTAWAEMPPSRTRRLITNIRVVDETEGTLDVSSNFLVYRTRMETDQDIFVGTRKDSLRRQNGNLRIARRTIILDQAVLGAKNISIFL